MYDAEGGRVIADLPPGLYFCVGKRGVVVGIDRDRRARVYSFLPGGGRGEGRLYPGHVLGLARAAFERALLPLHAVALAGPRGGHRRLRGGGRRYALGLRRGGGASRC